MPKNKALFLRHVHPLNLGVLTMTFSIFYCQAYTEVDCDALCGLYRDQSTPSSEETSNSDLQIGPVDHPTEPNGQPAPPPQNMTPIYDEGYWIIAPDKKMRIGGLLEIDGR